MLTGCGTHIPIPPETTFTENHDQQYSFTGIYDTTWGRVNFTQKGKTITGTGTHSFDGFVRGNRIDGSWYRYGYSGAVYFVMSDDGYYIKGAWGYDTVEKNKKWLGKRIGPPNVIDKTKHIDNPIQMSTGTGFFVTEDGHILTNYHVVEKAKSIKVLYKGKEYSATIQSADKHNDIALIKIDFKSPYLYLSSASDTNLGDDVFTVGFPNIDIQGLSPKLTKGAVNSKKGLRDDPRFLQVSVPIQPGNSGGPLITNDGYVIGIITSKLDEISMAVKTGNMVQNVNYALKIEYAKILLNDVLRDTNKNASQHKNAVDKALDCTVPIFINKPD